ncbi:MAG: TA system VapC family ribonuclease toxin [Synechococcus sp. ELA057]
MTPDVNVLVAASRSDHPHYKTAMTWLEGALEAAAGGDRVRLLPMVSAGFLRLVTHPRVFLQPTPLVAAQEFLSALLSSDGVSMAPLGDEWPLLESLCRQHGLSGNAITDAWIAAAVLTRSDCLVTFDRDFVPLLPARQLVVLTP